MKFSQFKFSKLKLFAVLIFSAHLGFLGSDQIFAMVLDDKPSTADILRSQKIDPQNVDWIFLEGQWVRATFVEIVQKSEKVGPKIVKKLSLDLDSLFLLFKNQLNIKKHDPHKILGSNDVSRFLDKIAFKMMTLGVKNNRFAEVYYLYQRGYGNILKNNSQADKYLRDNKGRTLVHIAVYNRSIAMVDLLCTMGAEATKPIRVVQHSGLIFYSAVGGDSVPIQSAFDLDEIEIAQILLMKSEARSSYHLPGELDGPSVSISLVEKSLADYRCSEKWTAMFLHVLDVRPEAICKSDRTLLLAINKLNQSFH